LSLPYRLRARRGDPGGAAPPLLVLLHGRGGNELAMAGLADRFDGRYLVVSPRAPIETEPYAYQWFPEEFTAEGPRVTATDLERAAGLLRSFIAESVVALGADPSRVHVAGFSQGGTLALATVLADPDPIAGVVSMSGWLPQAAVDRARPETQLQEKPVLIIHGRRDDTIDPRLGRAAQEALGALGVAVELREPDAGHTTTPEMIDDASAWLTRLLHPAGVGR
jgi:phospholipase/carboxylesterase